MSSNKFNNSRLVNQRFAGNSMINHPNLMLWMPMQAVATDMLGATVTVSGSPSYSALSAGQGITLDTSSKKVSLADASALKPQSFSIAFTFKRSSAGGWETDICK